MKALFLTALTVLTVSTSAQALEVGDTAPCVVLNHIATDGSEVEHCIRDSEVQGQAIVLDFFSITCSDCIASFPVVNRLAQMTGVDATFRLVAIDRDEASVREFITTRTDLVSHEVALDAGRDAKKAYKVSVTPTIFVLNPQYKVIFKHQGLVTEKVAGQIKQAINSIK